MRKNLTYLFSLLLTALFLLPWSGMKAATVDSDIAVGTNSNTYVPFYGSYVDTEGTKSQFIYLASELDELVGGTISALKFYTNKTASTSFGAVFSVKLAAVDEADFSGGAFLSPDFTEVYSGALSTNASGEMAISFSSNFTLPANKNLLVDVSVTSAASSWVSVSFYGQNLSNRSRSYYNGYGGGESNRSFVPKATFTFTPSPTMCLKPNTPVASNIGTETATITWTGRGDASNWKLQYKESTASEWNTVNVSEPTYNLTGLTAGSVSYDYRVQSDCGGESVSGWKDGVSFKTSCSKETVPAAGWTYSFETADGATAGEIPSCWARVAPTGISYPTIDASYTKHGSNKLHFQGKGATQTPQYIVFPEFDVDVKYLKISFWFRRDVDYSYTSKPIVGYFSTTDPTTSSTFTQLGTPSSSISTTYQKYELDLKDASDGAKRIAIRFNGGTSASYTGGLFIDSIKIVSTIDCSKPATPVASDITGTTAHLSWDANYGVSSYKYYYTTNNEAPAASVWTSAPTVNTNSVDLSELTAGTTYYFYVMCDCGDVASNPCTFTPSACPAVTGVTLDGGTYNSITVNWTTGGTTDCDVRYSTNGGTSWSEPITGISEDHKAVTVSVGSTYTFAVKPSCSADGWVTAGETFAPVYSAPANAAVASFTDVTATASWNAVADAPNGYKYIVVAKDATPDWDDATATDELSASLTGLAGLTDYDFYVAAVYGTHVEAADKVSFQTTAIAPKTLTNTALGATSATFTWAQGGAETQYQWAVVAKNAEPESWSEALAVNVRQVEVTTGLTANTNYDFCVRSYYGTGKYSDLVRLNFTTDCADITIDAEHPWVCGFESAQGYSTGSTSSAAPTCWAKLNANDGSRPYAYVSTNSSWKKSGTQTLYIDASSSRDGYMILPAFNAPLNTLQIAFSHKSESASNSAIITLGYMTNIADATTFVPLKTFTRSTSWSDETESLADIPALVANTARLAFKLGKATDNWYSGIDDITISVLPSCPKPTDLTKTASYFDGALFSWTAGGEESVWALEYSTSNSDWSGAMTINVTENSYRLSGLATGTYYARVKAVCGVSEESEYSNVVSFTAAYAAPTDLAITSITSSSASISWTANSGEEEWTLQYKKSSASEWNNVAVTTNSYSLSGLDAATNYDVRILAGTVNSTTESFQTECVSITSLPWKADFEGFTANTIPTCWDNSASTSTNSASDNYYIWGVYSYNENKTIRMCNYYVKPSGGSVATINSPSIVLPASPAYELAFDYTHNSDAGAMTVSIYNGENWTDLGTYTKGSGSSYTDPGTMTGVIISLADYANKTIKLRFSAPANYSNGAIFVDNVEVRQPITCPKPTAVTISSITAHTAQVAWTNGGSESAWAIQTSTDGTNWSAEIAANANPFTVTGLEANATYYVRVKAVCGENDESEWSAKSSAFDTPCDANALGWNEGFEGGSLPDCWKESHSGSYGWSVSNEKKYSGSYAIRFYSRSTSGSATLEAPLVHVTSNAVLEFAHMKANDATISASVQIWVNGVHKRTKSISAVYNQWNTDTIQLFGSDYENKDVAIKFVGTHNGYSRYLYLDDVRVVRTLTLADNVDNSTTLSTYNGKTADVTIGRTFVKAGYYNTICLPFDLSADELAASPIASNDLWAFKYAREEAGELLIRIIETDHINAGEPYLIAWPAGDPIVNPLFKNVTISASAGKTMGNENLKFTGILAPETFAAHDDTKLFLYTENKLYWWDGDAESTMNSFRAYFLIDNSGSSSHAPIRRGMPARIIKQEQVATGVGEVQGNHVQSTKILENNQVVIIRNGEKYNVQGQKIQ